MSKLHFARALSLVTLSALALNARAENPKSFGVGFNPQFGVDSRKRGIEELKQLGVPTVRIWHSLRTWSDPGILANLNRTAGDLKKAGFHVFAIIHIDGGKKPTGATLADKQALVRSAFRKVLAFSDANGKLIENVDLWQVGNEPDLKPSSTHPEHYYWEGQNLGEYVQQFLSPAADVLAEAGEDVASAGPNWNPDNVGVIAQEIKKVPGLWSKVDYLGYHPYIGSSTSCASNTESSLNLLRQRLEKARTGAAGKPLVASEWHMKLFATYNSANRVYVVCDAKQRAAANKLAYPIIHKYFALAYFFAAYENPTQQAGSFSILRGDGTRDVPGGKLDAMYQAFRAFPTLITDGPTTPDPPAAITGATLVNVKSSAQVDVTTITPGATRTVDIGAIERNQGSFTDFALEFSVNDEVDHIAVRYNGTSLAGDAAEPFTSFGETAGTTNGRAASVGTHRFEVTPYTVSGTPGTTVSFTLTLTDIDLPPPQTGASAAGRVYADANQNGILDNGETGLGGRIVYLDINNNRILDAGETGASTASDGSFSISGLIGAAASRLRVAPVEGQRQTAPANDYGYDLGLPNSTVHSNRNFGFFAKPVTFTVKGTVYNDRNQNRSRDTVEAGIGGVVVYNDFDNDHALDSGEVSTKTAADGTYTLNGLTSVESSRLRAIIPTRARQTYPLLNYGHPIAIAPGTVKTNLNFGIYR